MFTPKVNVVSILVLASSFFTTISASVKTLKAKGKVCAEPLPARGLVFLVVEFIVIN